MRVLYCTDTYPPQVNGVSIVTAVSVAGLARLGWECAVAAPSYPASVHAEWGGQGLAEDGPTELVSLQSVALPGYPEIRIALPRAAGMHDLVRRFRPDLVHCETEFSIGRMGQLAAARAGVPAVSSYHTDFARYTDAYGAPWLRGTVSSYLGRFHRRSRRVYTPSTASREDLLRLRVSNVQVWGRGVDTEVFHPGRRSQDMRAALGIGSRYTFLYVGRLAAEKRPQQVLDAFRVASDTLPRGVIHLVVAGAGPLEDQLRASAPPGVTFLGTLERRGRLPDLYANCDAFAFASVTETLGLVLLEAMASGLPLVATPAGGVRDHLRDGHNGLACPAGDVGAMARAMVQLAGDWGLAQRLSRGARRTAEALTWEGEIERLDRSYREVCAGMSGNQQETVVPRPRSLSA
ncbi:MAG: glycosyltransferase family 1 protein [Gemmatimonadota bacterium]|nr:glycosyltransferase family 1 protein [Gemmatimonadota bacterium]